MALEDLLAAVGEDSSTEDELRCLRIKLDEQIVSSSLSGASESEASDDDNETSESSDDDNSSASSGSSSSQSSKSNHGGGDEEEEEDNDELLDANEPTPSKIERPTDTKHRPAASRTSSPVTLNAPVSIPSQFSKSNSLRTYSMSVELAASGVQYAQMSACDTSSESSGEVEVLSSALASPVPPTSGGSRDKETTPPEAIRALFDNNDDEDDNFFPFLNDLDDDKMEDETNKVNNVDKHPPSSTSLSQEYFRPPSQSNRSQQSPTSIAADEADIFQLDDLSFHPGETKSLQPAHDAPPPVLTEKDDAIVERPLDEREQVNQRAPEVHHSLYEPPQFVLRPDPIVHHFTLLNRPTPSRRNIPVSKVFDHPVTLLWKSKFQSFNHMQSEIANVLAHSNDNVIVSAPTGAGKTAVFEMAMARLLSNEVIEQRSGVGGGRNQQLSKRRKIVYIAPSKALCEERFEDWSSRLSQMRLGIEVALITGDGEHGDSYRDAMTAHVILTTPEKWDSLTRRWTEMFFLFASVKLFLIDEVHLIGDGSRGCCLESIVCRMKTIQRAAAAVQVTDADIQHSSYKYTTPVVIASRMRIVAVSATLPNLSDVAAFLDASEAYSFDESYRPVPLTTHVRACGFVGDKEYFFWNSLSKKVPEVIRTYSKERPTIVFCHTKKEAEGLAEDLALERGVGYSHGTVKLDVAAQSKSSKLQKILLRGIAYHHAGLEASDRRLVEKAFESGQLMCLCATSTLAMGVNLPAHLVIVKGTRTWRGGYEDIDAGTLLQMIGRAGRPGYDTSGTAVIMTDNSSKTRIEQLSTGGLGAADSQLRNSLVEVLNTEISQRVVTSSLTALNWLKGTYFFIRATKNPALFGDHVASSQSLDAHLIYLCETAIKQLRDHKIVELADQNELVPLPASHIMSQHMVAFEAMQRLVSLPYDANQCQVLEALSEIDGIQKPVRRDEKKHLNEAHKVIKYKLKGPASKIRIQTPAQKAFVLLQAAVGQHFFDEATLRQEMSTVAEFGCRILSAAEEFSVIGSKHGRVALQSLKLRRSLATSLWGENDGVLNQLRGVGQNTAGSLRLHGITHFRDVLRASEDELETKGRRLPPFGKQLRDAVTKILLSSLCLTASLEPPKSRDSTNTIVCHLKRFDNIPNLDFSSATAKDNKTPAVTYTVLAFADQPGGCLFFQTNVTSPREIVFRCPENFGQISIHLVASLVGLDEKVVIEGNRKGEKTLTTKKSPQLNDNQFKKLLRDPSQRLHLLQKEAPHPKNPLRTFVLRESTEAAPTTGKRPAQSKQKVSQPSRMRSNPAVDKSQAVTPSPKMAPMLSNTRETSTEPPSKRRSTIHNSVMPPYSATPRTIPHQLSRGKSSNATSSTLHNSVTPPISSTPMTRTTERSRTHLSGATDVASSAMASPSPHALGRPGVVPWNREKRANEKAQQMAFAKRGDNPFSSFKFDPNSIESNIEALSSSTPARTCNDIIPPATRFSQYTTGTANSRPGMAAPTARYGRAGNSAGPFTRRGGRRRQFHSLGEIELLRQKAEEAGFEQPNSRFFPNQQPQFASFAQGTSIQNSRSILGRNCDGDAPPMQSRFWPQHNGSGGRTQHSPPPSQYGMPFPQDADSFHAQPMFDTMQSTPQQSFVHNANPRVNAAYAIGFQSTEAHQSQLNTPPGFYQGNQHQYAPNLQQDTRFAPHMAANVQHVNHYWNSHSMGMGTSMGAYDTQFMPLQPQVNYAPHEDDRSWFFPPEHIVVPLQASESLADAFSPQNDLYGDEWNRHQANQMHQAMEEEREFDETFF